MVIWQARWHIYIPPEGQWLVPGEMLLTLWNFSGFNHFLPADFPNAISFKPKESSSQPRILNYFLMIQCNIYLGLRSIHGIYLGLSMVSKINVLNNNFLEYATL